MHMSRWFNWFVAFITAVASIFGIGQFFGVDWKWITQQVTEHYIFAAISIVSLTIFVWSLRALWRRSRITPENVQPRVRQWLDAFNLGNRPIPDPQWDFGYEVTLQTGIPILVVRTRNNPHYLTLVCRIDLVQDHGNAYQRLSAQEQLRFRHAVRLEAAKSKIAYGANDTWNNLTIEKRIPITKDLTEAYLLDSLGEINFSVIVIGETIESLLESVRQRSPDPG